jgi:hypothetical protein
MPDSSPPELPARSPPAHLWTVAEADARIEGLADLLARLKEWAERLAEVQAGLARLAGFWGREIEASDHPDHLVAVRLDHERANLARRLEEGLGALASEGIEVKDLASGLVDFYALVDGELAYLCWRRGEPAVRHWHTLTGGFRSRRPILDRSPTVTSGLARRS